MNYDRITFEAVEHLKYLDVNLNNRNNMHKEIRLILNVANQYYSVQGSPYIFLQIIKKKSLV